MSPFEVGDRVRVTDSYVDLAIVGLKGTVRDCQPSHDGALINVDLDDRDQPYVFYGEEIEQVVGGERVVPLLEALHADHPTGGRWLGSAVDVAPHFVFKAPEPDERDERIEELEDEVKEWRGNHAGVVKQKRELGERYNDLFRAKVLPSLDALRELEELVRQLRPSFGDTYDDARDDVIDLITYLSQGL